MKFLFAKKSGYIVGCKNSLIEIKDVDSNLKVGQFLTQIYNEKNKVIVIAEAGVNHNGDINLAKKLVDIAANSELIMSSFNLLKLLN